MLIIVSLMLAINSFRLINRSQFVQNLNVRLASSTVDDHDHIKHVIKAELKQLSKAQVSLTTEALNSKRCEEFSSRASLIVSNLYRINSTTKQSIVVESYDDEGHPSEVLLKFNTEKFSSPKHEADWLFTKARKMRRGTAVVSDLLKSNEKKQAFLEQALSSPLPTEELKDQLISSKLTSITSFSPPSPSPTPTPPTKNQQPPSKPKADNYRQFFGPASENKLEILVGRNRKQNEKLSFFVAKNKDVWAHARGCPGAHVVIKNRAKNVEPSFFPETIQLASNLAIFYSNNRDDNKAEVTFSEPKHIMKPKGAPLGTVKLRHELFVRTGFPSDVPQECKDKRAEGTSADTYS